MKRVLFFFCIPFVAVFFIYFNAFALDFFIGAVFGVGYAPNSDINESVADAGDYTATNLNNLLGSSYFTTTDEKSDIYFNIDIEPRIFFGQIGIGISSGYHFTTASSLVDSDYFLDDATYKLSLKVIPIVGSLYYKINLRQDKFFLLGAGAGYYISTLTSVVEDNISISTTYGQTIKNDWKADGTIGYHAKIEYIRMFKSIAVFGGIMGRYLEIKGFEKSGTKFKNSDGSVLKAGLTGGHIYLGAGLLL